MNEKPRAVNLVANKKLSTEAQLREENALLRESVAYLYSILMERGEWCWPHRYGMSPQETSLLRLLYKQYPNICTKNMIFAALYHNRPEVDWAGEKIIDVIVCRLRKRFPSPKDSITNVWGRGWHLTASAKEWVDAEINKANEEPLEYGKSREL